MKTGVTIIGAGLVGMTTACALAKLGINVVVIDSADLNEVRKKESDGRTCAIAAGSANFFKEIDLWNFLKNNAGKILDIRVTDGNSPLFLHYDHKLVGDQPMGYIIENYHSREALFNKAEEFNKESNSKGTIAIYAPEKYNEIEFRENECIVKLESGKKITSRLLIAADGKNSNIRKIAGIETNNWDYDQLGIVCTIKHSNHHQNIAQERFLPEGPFAVLPMHGGHHSSLVWTEKTNLAKIYLSMNEDEIIEQIRMRTGEYLGDISLASKVYSYPLSLCKAKQYVAKNLILIGDAAHAMHPLAGQGFNVGIRDAEELFKILKNTNIEFYKDKNLVQPQLDDALEDCLLQYEKARMADSISLLAITDILNKLFSNNILPFRAARRLGLAFVNKTPPLKKFFMRHAMGVS